MPPPPNVNLDFEDRVQKMTIEWQPLLVRRIPTSYHERAIRRNRIRLMVVGGGVFPVKPGGRKGGGFTFNPLRSVTVHITD